MAESIPVVVPGFYGEAVAEHINDKTNPHDVLKAQLGLDKVQNFAVATPDVLDGTENENHYMTPGATKYLINKSSVISEAPVNGKNYARNNANWVQLPDDTEYWDVNFYEASVTLGPGNKVLELYPMLELSRAVLPNCKVRRTNIASENLTLKMKPTNGDDWTATCVIPAGDREGFFTSGSALPLNSSQGFYIMVDPLPLTAVTGLSVTLRFAIKREQTFSAMSVPQPKPTDTIITFGQNTDESKPTFQLRQLVGSVGIASSDVGGNVASLIDMDVSVNGATMVFLKDDGDIIKASARDGFTEAFKSDAVQRKGISFNKDATRLICGEFKAGKWWAVEYTLPSFSVYHETDLNLHGVTAVNSVKYSPNDRYIVIGHSTGGLVLNALTYAAMALTDPPVGPVLDMEITPSIYAVMSRQVNKFSLHVMSVGQRMTTTAPTVWTNITASAFNWFADVPSPYPYFVAGGQTSNGWEVVPYVADNYSYSEMSWRINFGEKIVGIAFSEASLDGEFVVESTYGRTLLVFGEHRYRIYDLRTGVEVANRDISNFTTLTGVLWKSVAGAFE